VVDDTGGSDVHRHIGGADTADDDGGGATMPIAGAGIAGRLLS
jgi:hypothetical protein